MTAARLAALGLAGALLAGCCSTVTTDPRAGGLAGGTCGAMTGAYEARLADRRSTIASLAGSSQALERRLASSTADAGRQAADVNRERARLGRERQAVARLDDRIAEGSAGAAAQRQELAAIRDEIKALDRELAQLIRESSSREATARALRDGVAVAGNERQAGESPAAVARRQEIEERLAVLRRKLQAAGG